MADTTYNSVGVDEVAAQHVNAQCVVSLSSCQSMSQVIVYKAHTLVCILCLFSAGCRGMSWLAVAHIIWGGP
jgi:hypothetical protein